MARSAATRARTGAHGRDEGGEAGRSRADDSHGRVRVERQRRSLENRGRCNSHRYPPLAARERDKVCPRSQFRSRFARCRTSGWRGRSCDRHVGSGVLRRLLKAPYKPAPDSVASGRGLRCAHFFTGLVLGLVGGDWPSRSHEKFWHGNPFPISLCLHIVMSCPVIAWETSPTRTPSLICAPPWVSDRTDLTSRGRRERD